MNIPKTPENSNLEERVQKEKFTTVSLGLEIKYLLEPDTKLNRGFGEEISRGEITFLTEHHDLGPEMDIIVSIDLYGPEKTTNIAARVVQVEKTGDRYRVIAVFEEEYMGSETKQALIDYVIRQLSDKEVKPAYTQEPTEPTGLKTDDSIRVYISKLETIKVKKDDQIIGYNIREKGTETQLLAEPFKPRGTSDAMVTIEIGKILLQILQKFQLTIEEKYFQETFKSQFKELARLCVSDIRIGRYKYNPS